MNILVLEEREKESEDIVTELFRNKDENSKAKVSKGDKDVEVEACSCIEEGKSLTSNKKKIEGEDTEMEELKDADEDIENDTYSMSVDESDSERTSTSGISDESETIPEAPLPDAEIEELVAEFLEVESKAAEAQESLEKESLAKVETEVRSELAESLHGDALDMAVSTEMETFIENWEIVLDDLEAQSALLLEQLDGAGIELPSLYRLIESQAPNGCYTDAWKKRAHWVGSQLTAEFNQSVKDAEADLQSRRPVRRHHGKLLEEGASGYLARKLLIEDKNSHTENTEKDWSTFNVLIQSHGCLESTSFGSQNWASVYFANTPQQAANLGIKFPGVDEVEEIGDVDCSFSDPFYADAITNEQEIDLSEEQKRNFRKVREEEDANITKKLQHHLKRHRQRNKKILESTQKEVFDGDMLLNKKLQHHLKLHRQRNKKNLESTQREVFDGDMLLNECSRPISESPNSYENGVDNGDSSGQNSKSAIVVFDETRKGLPFTNGKRSHDNDDTEVDYKRCRTVIIDSDDEVLVLEDTFTSNISNVAKDQCSALQPKKMVDIIDVDIVSSSSIQTKVDTKEFQCTACSKVLQISEVRKHPRLEVIICGSCKLVVEEKYKFEDGVFCRFCEWCGNSNDLISCDSCKKLLCELCITRNFGEGRLSSAKASGWECCCCLPILLDQFVLECEKVLGGQAVSSSASDSEFTDAETSTQIRNKKRRKKVIRRILDDAELGEETKRKIAMEKDRQEHLKLMQLQSAGKSCSKNIARLYESAKGDATVDILGNMAEGFIVNVVREQDEEPVRIPPSISAKLKPHQVAGIRFMWENIILSVRKVRSGDKGLGCILAHTMGLGKTFQVITFLYAALRGVDLGLKTALIVTPVNVLHNWRQEFLKWKPLEYKSLRVLMLEDVSREKRATLLAKWRAKGGVLLIGYAAFRNLSLGKHMKDKNTANEICNALQCGPDILVCDEAHIIKNKKADTTYALKQVKTQRRIALTGSPLQNNLMEYYCMVDFVREGFLGSSHEFRNRFQNPIENGQHANSTSVDVKIMNQRSHILYEQLKGFVQRMDMNVVKKDLPPKTVFVITVKLSSLQEKLYKRFLDDHACTNGKVSSEKTIRQSCFFAGYQTLAQIWNHPGLLQMAKEHINHVRQEDAVENFILDDSSSDDNAEHNELANGEKQRSRSDLMPNKSGTVFHHEENDWWEHLLDEKLYKEADYSGKMVLLLDILSMSSEVGDKALVFSQSLTTLDLIEMYLSKLPRKGGEGKYWRQGKDWYRLDGRTAGSERQKLVDRFNETTNKRVKCTLISTRAGSLGINLHAANRVILVDSSWNPTYDLQAIYRVWRYGQCKPVYAYRLMAHRTMEEKIYKRQVTKEGLAARVVDKQQIYRTMSKEEILHLFEYGDDETGSTEQKLASKEPCLPLPQSVGSCDKLMEMLLSRHYPRWIANYHEHETLFQEDEADRLSKEEQDLAWQIYQQSLTWEEVHRTTYFDERERKTTQQQQQPIERNNVVSQQTTRMIASTSRAAHQRKCSNLSHLLTLRSEGTVAGSSTVCRECKQEISWENLNRDSKAR